MIARRTETSWIVVAQADHARLAGELIALARVPELVDSSRRKEVLRAVAEHDNGWWEEDAAPRLDPGSGGPLDFRALPGPVKRAIWSRGVERYAAREPYVAALVAGHFLRLLASWSADPDWRVYAEAEQARRLELLAAAGRSEDEARADDRWLRLGDELSLVATTLEPALLGTPGWSCAVAERAPFVELRVSPFPWAGATRFALDVRRVPLRRYADAVELGTATITARIERLPVRLVPLAG